MGVQRVPRQSESRGRLSLSPAGTGTEKPSWLRRIGWLVLLWIAGVATVAVVAIVIRVFMTAAGLKT
ncbi:DUF2474 family protein [Hyphomicrobium sp.]|uniref:DUF2474 family protein n=1 Tax=Hyphomicrobium sp. TaxID=82 RepID=UPI000FB90FB6|nr:DUF2474 family protein [Hyphomicrobium sp.]RUP08270.1 MAG: DUF2474 family protein [Hyphomicrobium sp.]